MVKPTATWTDDRERQAIRAHLRRCAFCGALWRYGMRRRDPEVLTAAERLTREHAANDAEREAFARSGDTDPATAHPRGSSMRMTVPGSNPR